MSARTQAGTFTERFSVGVAPRVNGPNAIAPGPRGRGSGRGLARPVTRHVLQGLVEPAHHLDRENLVEEFSAKVGFVCRLGFWNQGLGFAVTANLATACDQDLERPLDRAFGRLARAVSADS